MAKWKARPAAVCFDAAARSGASDQALAFVLTVGPVSRFPNSKKTGELSGLESQ